MSEETLPAFPVDDVTLAAVEHALGGAFIVDEDGTHRLAGADYTLAQLLNFMAGTMGEDPNAEVIDPGSEEDDDPGLPEFLRGIARARIVIDSRIHYSEHDVIRSLIAEVRRLRADDPTRPGGGQDEGT